MFLTTWTDHDATQGPRRDRGPTGAPRLALGDAMKTIKATEVWGDRQGWGFSAWLIGPFASLDTRLAWRRIELAATRTGGYATRPDGERIGVRVRRHGDRATFDVVL